MKGYLSAFLFLFFASKTVVFSLYEDQIGKFDWRLQFIGKPKHVVFGAAGERDGQNARVYMITEQNVVAALNWYNGEIIWRHVLEKTEVGRLNGLLLSQTGDVITLSGGGQHVMNWEKHRGTSRWSTTVSNEYCETSKFVEYKSGSVAVLSPCGSTLSSIDRAGSQTWTLPLHKQAGGDRVQWHDVAASGGEIVVLGEDKSTSTVMVMIISSSGAVLNTITRDIKYDSKKLALLSHPNRIVWFDAASGMINSLALSATTSLGEPIGVPISNAGDLAALRLEVYSNRFWALMSTDRVYIPTELTNDQSKEAFQLQRLDGVAVGITTNQEGSVYAAVATLSPRGGFIVQFYDTKSSKHVTEWDIVVPANEAVSSPANIYPYLRIKSDRATGGSVFVVGEDHSVAMLNHPGKIIWTRQEALASILSVEMLDLPLSEAQANIEEEFSTNGTLLTMFTRRVTTQAVQLQRLLMITVNEALGLADLLEKSSEALMAPLASDAKGRAADRNVGEREARQSPRLERDYFNLRKIVVVTTGAGKIFGLDSASGAIVWQKYLMDGSPFTKLHGPTMPIYVLRTTAHYPHPARCAVVSQHKTNGRGLLITFNPITGAEFDVTPLDHSVKQSFILPVVDEHELQGIGMVTDGLKLMVYPPSVGDVFSNSVQRKPFVSFLADELGTLRGYRVAGMSSQQGEQLKIFELEATWKTLLPLDKEGRVSGLAMKRFTEHVHSQGRVLGDRSVLYKYLNPNLVAVMADGVDSSGKNQMSIYLLDAVTGDIMFTAVHRRVSGPYHIVHCENWIVYTYWNEKAWRKEITVLELYEGKEQADPAKFSSFNPPSAPIIMRQAYIFPQGISALAVTDTEKGITARHLLIAMPFGGILELSKAFLDPRRVLIPTMEEREEGLYPYIPELPIMTEQIINYNQSVYSIRGIHAAPSGLESTSLILAYGLDLYFTRVTPSGTFDILKDDFDHWFIACVLLCLFLGSVIAKKIARHRDVKSAWR